MVDVDDDSMIEVNVPGAYACVCVDLEIDSLAINTILQAAHINDAEGGAGDSVSFDAGQGPSLEEMMGGDGENVNLTSFDDTAQCTQVFRVLKHLVQTWLNEVVNYQNTEADRQLQHFYRWLKDSKAALYDPGLCKMVRYMMKKVFMQLLAEFRRLGAEVIHATMNRIVICTKKSNCEAGRAYIDYILSTIKDKQLFGTINIEPTDFWEHLARSLPVHLLSPRSPLPNV